MTTATATATDRLFEVDSLLGLTAITPLNAEYKNRVFCDQLRQQMIAYADENEPRRVIVNFENIELQMVFSPLLGAVLNFSRHIQPDGAQATMCNMAEVLQEQMAIVDPQQRMFHRFDTLGQAWDWLRSLDAAAWSQREHVTVRPDGRLFEVGTIRGVMVLTLLDAEYMQPDVCQELRQQLGAYVAEHRPRQVIINFENFRFPNLFSRLAGVLFDFQKKCLKPVGGNTALCNMPEIVKETFRVFDPNQQLLRTCETVGQAYDWLRSL